MLDRFGMTDANAVRSPFVIGQDLTPDDSHARFDDKTKYRELIGSMLYVANCTRPDISVAMSILSQYLADPREMHWRVGLRVLSYLKGTASLGIRYTKTNPDTLSLYAYSDANWGGDKSTRRSTSGVLVTMNGGPVIYKIKRQATVALSSAEAEFMALALATQEVIWLRYLLEEIGAVSKGPTVIHLDNQSATSIATNHGHTQRAKHIDLRAHFVRDHVENGNIIVKYIPSENQLADFFTKPLPTPRFAQLRDASGVTECSS
jgi:hypothetical protein